jgi:hypothetical protein
MQRLNEQDLTALVGLVHHGYTIRKARHKGGNFSDSDCYGIVLGEGAHGWVTWQFHIEDGEISLYWGHYFYKENAVLADYAARD